MPTFRSTTFTWFTGEGQGANEEAAVGAARVTAPIDIRPGDFNTRVQAVGDILGFATVLTDSGKRYISRQTPMPYPTRRYDGEAGKQANPAARPHLYATSLMSGKPVGVTRFNNEGQNDSDLYRAHVTFETRMYLVAEDLDVLGQEGPLTGLPDEGDCLRRGYYNTRYVTRRIRPGGHMRNLREGILSFLTQDTSGKSYIVPGGVMINELDYLALYTWHLVPRAGIPWLAILNGLGTVNDALFDAGSRGVLLLTNVQVDERTDPLGEWVADITYTMHGSPRKAPDGSILGHNSAPRKFPPGVSYGGTPVGNKWGYDAVSDNSGNGIYRETSFPALFRPDQ